MKKGEIYEGVIEKVDFPNKGYVFVEDQKVLIKNGIPGQKVRFMIQKKRSGRAQGRILEVMEKSPLETREPVCSNFPACGGCMYQTMSYEDQLHMKETQIRELLEEALIQGGQIDENGNALIGGRILSVAQLPEVTVTPVYNTVPSQIARPIDFKEYSLIDDIKKQNDMFSGRRLMDNIHDNYVKYWQDTYKMPIKINDGGWTKDEIKSNRRVHNTYDPTSSIDPVSWTLNRTLGGNLAKGEED